VLPVIHRIDGWKLLILLDRHDLQTEGEPASDLMHTNIVAGYALDGGRYVVARLPQAELEAVARDMPSIFDGCSEAGDKDAKSCALAVVAPSRKESPARFVGLDGRTGLSLLELYGAGLYPTKKNDFAALFALSINAMPSVSVPTPRIGTRLRLLAPEFDGKKKLDGDAVRLRMNETTARITSTVPSGGGRTTRFVARPGSLKASLNGSVAINDTGAFVGVVERITSDEVFIIPGAEVFAAARRLLTRRESLPQPWFGAHGQPLATTNLKTLVESGWQKADAQRLLAQTQGVMLTVVPPYTPAALADLRAGDIVTGIGDRPVKGVEDFSRLLSEVGGNARVRFTVRRAEEAAQRVAEVQLSESLDPMRETERAVRQAYLAAVGDSVAKLLLPLGIESVTAPAGLREQLGAAEGLLIVSVRPGGIAAKSGLRPGDIIERTDGKPLSTVNLDSGFPNPNRTEITFEVLRAKQRISVTIKYPAK